MLTIVSLTNDEKFLEQLNPDRAEITEITEIQGLKCIEFTYTFEDFTHAKELFKSGNKIWIQGHSEIDDCLYVINTEIQQDLCDSHTFSFTAEDVLTELNNAPLALQTQLTTSNGFRVNNTNDAVEVTINWNALHYWFGDYFNIGIIQECLGNNTNKISFSGSMTLMSLLRLIEESTGNRFITRYEKDVLDNTIHRYLDFLNPNSENRNWEWCFEYDFQDEPVNVYVLNEDDTVTTDKYDDVEDPDSDLVTFLDLPAVVNIDPENTVFRLTDKKNTLVGEDENPLEWSAEDVGFTNTTESIVFNLKYNQSKVTFTVNNKTFPASVTSDIGSYPKGYVNSWTVPAELKSANLPNETYFEIYDTSLEMVVFRHELNPVLCNVHSEVLDLGYNVENISLNIDESETYSAISPVLSLNQNSGASNELSRTDMNKILNAWLNLEIGKGDTVPMILEKVNITATSLTAAKGNMSNDSKSHVDGNYFSRPYKPNDNTDSDSKTYEFWRGTAYWSAPFTKLKGDFHVSLDNNITTDYTYIRGRPDTRDIRDYSIAHPKMGQVETSDEDVYAIYNAVCMKLKEKKDPKIDVQVDVAELKDGQYNNFQLYEKVYVKLPGTDHLVEAQVTKTSKNAHLTSENTVTLSNYDLTVPVATKQTWIDSTNKDFKYPNSEKLTAILVNDEYDSSVEGDIEFLNGKLLTFTVYKLDENDSRVFYKAYAKKTNSNGVASLQMKYKPGDYEIDIQFAGDVEYSESFTTVEVNVGGTVAKVKSTTNKATSTSKKTKTVKRYWSKCGKSPDKKKVIAIGKPSASVSDAKKRGLSMNTTYTTVFKNKCPECGHEGTLVFDGGKKNKCVTSAGAHGRGYKVGVPEHEITCNHCDSDFDACTGLEKNAGHSTRLTTLKKPVVSGKSEFNKLVTGKLLYDTVTETVKSKKKSSTKTRNNVSGGIPSDVKKKALSIVNDSKGIAAAKKIVKYVLKEIKYEGYANHRYSPKQVQKRKKGNCCDQTRYMLTLMDAAGCREYLRLRYVHVHGNGGGHVFARIYNKSNGKKVYADPTHGGWNNCLQSSKYGFLPGSEKDYTYGGTGY